MKAREKKYHLIKKILKLRNRLTGCFEFPFFGARYPDATCIDGLLWDLDSGDHNGLTIGGADICPVCHTEAFIRGMIDCEISIERTYTYLHYIFTCYGKIKTEIKQSDIGGLFVCGECGKDTGKHYPFIMMTKVHHEGESRDRYYCPNCIDILYPAPTTPIPYAN